MFRMKFQSTVEDSTSGDEEDERTVREDSSVSCSSEPGPKVVFFEGKVGKFGKIRPLPTTDKPFPGFTDDHPSLRSMILSPAAQLGPTPSPKPKLADIDLVNLEGQPSQESAGSSPQQAYLHYQDSIRGQDPKLVFVEAPCAVAESRSDSSRSEPSECSTSTHRNEEEDEAVTEMINKFMQERKNILQKNEDKFAKPWEEPLLAAHDQEELDVVAKEEAKVEAKRLAEIERLEHDRQLRELRDLAHCKAVPAPYLGRSPTFKESKLRKILGKSGVAGIYRFLKSPFRIFRSHKKYTEYPDAREAKGIIPKASVFGGCRSVPSSGTTDSQLATMRNAPQPRITRRPHIQFATVESTQRDVPAWTREEYLRKNGRIPQNSTNKKEDKEFGGIEGNNLMNQYFDDHIVTDYDSDSD